jgi:arginyl-tRNA--protein-N-Asp/Glu arginylyltransferase
MDYLHWNTKTVTDVSEQAISDYYAAGYVFTRLGKGIMHQTRSVRIDLTRFKLSSENRRILKKTGGLSLEQVTLPFITYVWTIGKTAKDFYDTKFAPGIMSAQKVRAMLTEPDQSNFNTLYVYSIDSISIGYTITYQSSSILHYSYPFYNLTDAPKDIGLGMMIRAIIHAQDKGLQYAYLGSLQRPNDTYKLQFEGLEWFTGSEWSADLEQAKKVILN